MELPLSPLRPLPEIPFTSPSPPLLENPVIYSERAISASVTLIRDKMVLHWVNFTLPAADLPI